MRAASSKHRRRWTTPSRASGPTVSRIALCTAARRVLIAHLGGGQSLCGTADGRSIVTTMGFTPLDGLVMGTRCGSLDPGALLWLQDHLAAGDKLDDVLDEQSGLLGLCGMTD